MFDRRGSGALAPVCLVAFVALAGCLGGPAATEDATLTAMEQPDAEEQPHTSPDTDPPPPEPQDAGLTLEGTVEDASGEPVAGAHVEVMDLGQSATTDEAGAFRFEALPLDTFLLRVTADGFLPWDKQVRGDGDNVMVLVELEPAQIPPFHESVPFEGFIECAVEVLIIPGSCGRVVAEYTEVDDPFQTRSVLEHGTEDGWKTIIVDVTWQELPPSLQGLRVSAYSAGAANDLGEYERFARAWGSEPFTLRIDAGEQYEEGPQVPEGPALFQFEVFPQGHGYNTICDPDGTCFLGIGAGLNVEFELFLTTFYHEPAPEGWTIADA